MTRHEFADIIEIWIHLSQNDKKLVLGGMKEIIDDDIETEIISIWNQLSSHDKKVALEGMSRITGQSNRTFNRE